MALSSLIKRFGRASSHKRLILHVGDCKTGSSTLQQALQAGQIEVPGKVLLYPDLFPVAGNHSQLARTLTDEPNLREARWSALRESLEQTNWDLAVLSGELFEFTNPEHVDAALREFLPDLADQTEIVLYLRPHASRLVAQFAEGMKLGQDLGSFDDFFAGFGKKHLNYASRLSAWKLVFGDRLTVRAYAPDQLVEGDILRDFVATALPDGIVHKADAPRRNEQLGLPDLTLLAHIHRLILKERATLAGAQVDFGVQLAEFLRATPVNPSTDRLQLPSSIYERLVGHYSEDAQSVDDQFFPAGFLVPAMNEHGRKTIDTAQPLEAEAWQTPETLRLAAVFARLITQQLDRDEGQFSRLCRQRE